jgi:3-deoxy-D-manno-octulosonate 8-phosphate phosphatase (KDO 8-P phosphatase)
MDIKLRSRLGKIKTFIFDVDGVFTDATLVVSDHDVTRIFNVRDGYAVQMASKAGYNLAAITGGKQDSIKSRLTSLGIKDVYHKIGTANKLETFDKYIAKYNLKIEEAIYVGDDIPDYLLMSERNVLSMCPADAVDEVKAVCDYVSKIKGGKGVVREVIEMVMKTQNTWLKQF